MNAARLKEIQTMNTVIKKLNECEQEYIEFLIENSNKQMNASIFNWKRQANSQPGGQDPVCTSTSTQTTNPSEDIQGSTHENDFMMIPVDEIDSHFKPSDQTLGKPIENNKDKNCDEIKIFREEYISIYNDDENLEFHAQHLKNILQEEKSLLSLVNLMDTNDQKLDSCMASLQQESESARLIKKSDLKTLTNVLIHLARKAAQTIVDHNEDVGLQNEMNSRVIRMIKRVSEESSSSCNQEPTFRAESNFLLNFALGKALREIIKGESSISPVIQTDLKKLIRPENQNLIKSFHNQVIIYKEDSGAEHHPKGMKIKIVEQSVNDMRLKGAQIFGHMYQNHYGVSIRLQNA